MANQQPPSAPKVLVELGRAVELDSDEWVWTWNKRDNWIIAASVNGKRLYLFPRPKQRAQNPVDIQRHERLYKVFNRRESDELLQGNIRALKRRAGRANHVVYHSDKFGRGRDYIHIFDNPPIVWVDKPNLPRIVGLTGGDIRITKRGIEG
jgi:hypothetical protein